MCLITNTRARNNPKKELHVYKVLVTDENKSFFRGPHTKYKYKLNEVLFDEAEEEIETKARGKFITSGYFHSFTSLEKAKQLVTLCRLSILRADIYKAIIPPKTKYYVGLNGDICSKSIKILDDVLDF